MHDDEGAPREGEGETRKAAFARSRESIHQGVVHLSCTRLYPGRHVEAAV
jgi:hypothetical protein